jgi:predicted PurR-regulated permease PerM
MNNTQKLLLAALAGLLVLLYFLGNVLAPFAISAALAYLGDPLVDRLERYRMSRTFAVFVVFSVLFLAGLLILVTLAPALYSQVAALVRNIPDWLHWLQETGLPSIGIVLPEGVRLDAQGFKQMLADNWSEAGGVAKELLKSLSHSGVALLEFGIGLAIVPIATFYLLRDWDALVEWIDGTLPPRHRDVVRALARETDEVLGSFLRGQLLVMAVMGGYYSIALSLTGLKFALLIGLGAGLVSFVPYLGFSTGVLVAGIAMLVQTHSLVPVIWVGLVFAAGHVLEAWVLVPWLVGRHIGLHPVAVIFALMAGGKLFGFVGVLVALPAAAVLAVLLRHAHARFLESDLHKEPGAPPEQDAP